MGYYFRRVLFTALFGFLTCIILGYIFYGNYVFRFIDSRSLVVATGGIGSLYFAILRLQSGKVKLLVTIVLIIGYLVFVNSFSTTKAAVRELVYLVAIFSALNIYFRTVFRKINSPLFVRSIILCLIMTFLHSMGTLVLAIMFEPDLSDISLVAFTNSQYAAVCGLAMGLGFDLHEKLLVRAKWKNEYVNKENSGFDT